MRRHFPFTAIIGQARLKTALLLISIDPAIGGLLLSGPRGSAKSTLVRSLASLNHDQPFVTVPLGASEEMVTGSLDLDQALSQSQLAFKPGLLAKANEGILYVDEVNLLADHLVDLLLDAAASGTNLIERDGISHQHDALFSLVGTMNPDEGELRPQLLDRFGLMANVDTQFSIEQRQLVVKQRLAFDSDPDKFIDQQQVALSELSIQLNWAIENLPIIAVGENISHQIAQRCADAHVEGFRADITMHRASRAHAALHRRLEVFESDLDAIEDLVLNHRRNTPPPSTQPPPSSNSSAPDNTPDNSVNTPQTNSQSGSSIQGSWGAMELVTTDTHQALALPDQAKVAALPTTRPAASATNSQRKGNSISNRFLNRISMNRALIGTAKIDWFRSLTTKIVAGSLQSKHLKYRYPQLRSSELKLVLLDTSASTLAGKGLAYAKGVLKELSRQAYLKRQQICILTFGNNQVSTLIQTQRAPKNIQSKLDMIKAGGGTPIRQVLDQAQHLLLGQRHQHLNCSIYLITDGRLEQSINSHALLSQHQVTIVDIESSRIKLGLGKQLADAVSAHYLPLSALTAV
jgi:magnesium chelatase subunit D